MYRTAARATSSTTELCDYVCYQCRHKTSTARRARRAGATQIRRESTQTVAVQDVDDWMNNFNSLETKAEKPNKPAKANSNPPKPRVPRMQVISTRQDGATLRRGVGLRKPLQTEPKPKTMAELYASLALPSGGGGKEPELLMDADESKSKPELSSDARGSGSKLDVSPKARSSSFKREESQAPTRAQQRRREHKAAQRQQQQDEGSERSRVAVAESLEKSTEAKAQDGIAGAAARPREQFERIMAELKVPGGAVVRPTEAVKHAVEGEPDAPVDDVGLPSQLTDTSEAARPEPPKRIETPDFPYPAAVKRVAPSISSTNGIAAATKAVHLSQAESVPETQDQHVPPAAPPTASTREYSFAKRLHPFSIAAKVKEAQNRPMWGGVPKAPSPAKPTKISFDSLAAADTVSVKAKPRTAGERTAWGSEPVKSTHAKVEQTTGKDDAALGDPLMDREFTEKHAAEPKAPTPAGVVQTAMNTIDTLRESLRVRLSLASPTPTTKGQAQRKTGLAQGQIEPSPAKDEASAITMPPGDEASETGFQIHKIGGASKGGSRRDAADAKSSPAQRVLKFGRARDRGLVWESATNDTIEADAGEDREDDSISRLAQLHKYESGMESSKPQTAEKSSPATESPAKPKAPRAGGGKDRPRAKSRGIQGEKPPHTSAVSSNPVSNGDAAASSAGDDGVGGGAEDHISMQAAMSSLDDSVAMPSEPGEDMTIPEPEMYEPSDDGSNSIGSMSAADLEVTALNIEQPPVPPVQYGLDRVLFNPGVTQLQDPHSRVFNFDPYLQKIMPIHEFDFNALKEYKTSSQDVMLAQIANEHGKKYIGSTSSMTSTLAHFHYLLSNWRPLNLGMLSKGFKEEADGFTLINKAPNAIFLRYKEASGTYAIDADKEHDTPNVLMMLGKSMEKLLTAPKEEYERYRLGNTTNPITPEEKDAPEAFEYTTMGDFLMRSQLDAHDPRLPGTGMFDLKTRACLSVRMDAENYEDMLGYEILTLQGRFESYEREYYDMMRSTMLKYMLQARMGRMDGIFVAYHNVERIFGFQYLPISDIDRAIHNQIDPCLGDQEFRFSLKLMNEALEAATKQFPEKSLRVHFECVEKPQKLMWIFAEPMEESEIKEIQAKGKDKIAAFEAEVMGLEEKEEKPMVDVVPAKDEEKKVNDAADAPATTAAVSEPTEPAKPAQEAVDYTSTTTPADPKFYSKITPPSEENLKPLFAATLIVQNLVDGQPCDGNRPQNLKRNENWEVQYIMKEADISLSSKWARYEDCRTRRRLTFAKAQDKDDDAVGEGAEPKPDRRESGYFKMLREMVERGRKFRKLVDKAEAGREKVVLGQTAKDKNEEVAGEEVKDVAGYMKWLYSKD